VPITRIGWAEWHSPGWTPNLNRAVYICRRTRTIAGDYFDQHTFWVHSLPQLRRWCDALAATGGDVDGSFFPARASLYLSCVLFANSSLIDLISDLLLLRAITRLVSTLREHHFSYRERY
jgi:hypothetical protein